MTKTSLPFVSDVNKRLGSEERSHSKITVIAMRIIANINNNILVNIQMNNKMTMPCLTYLENKDFMLFF